MIWVEIRQLEYSDPLETFKKSRVAFVLKILPHVKKKKQNKKQKWKKKCDKPSPFAASMKTVYASPRLLFLSSEMKWILSAPRFAFSKHRCEEPLIWTVIPLLKPWAEPYSNTPDAISNSTCAKKKKCSCTPK